MAKETKTETKIKKDFISGTGRRKTAVASVFIWKEKGEILVNNTPIETYFPTEKDQIKWLKPFHLIGVSHPKSKFDIHIQVSGSGKSSQLDAVIHGISRALATMEEEYHLLLSQNGMLSRDPRMVERKKPYLHKARKAQQYSKR